MGLIWNGPADASATPFVCYSYDEFVSQFAATGFDVNAGLSVMLRNQVSDFYSVAGKGAELWIMVDSANGVFTIDKGLALLKAAEGRINVLGIFALGGLDNNLSNLINTANACAQQAADLHMPIRALIDGANYSGNAVNALNLKTGSWNRVGVCISSIRADNHAALGLLLGMIASIPVNRNIGRIKNGVAATTVYLTSGTLLNSSTPNLELLHDKGYIFLRKVPTKAGYFWNDDHMACSDTDDYYSLSNGRVIDKVARIAHSTYLNELLDEVIVDQATGRIIPTMMKYYQTEIEQAVNLGMKAEGEVSGVQANVDPNQDVLATSKLVVELQVTPTGTNRSILVKLGLFNPANA